VAGGAVGCRPDRWTITGAVLSLSRKVSVTGAEDDASFSAIRLVTEPRWRGRTPIIWLRPALRRSVARGAGSPGGILHYRAKRFSIREDYLSPLLRSFRAGWVGDGHGARATTVTGTTARRPRD
jgi:hypothetical protein